MSEIKVPPLMGRLCFAASAMDVVGFVEEPDVGVIKWRSKNRSRMRERERCCVRTEESEVNETPTPAPLKPKSQRGKKAPS